MSLVFTKGFQLEGLSLGPGDLAVIYGVGRGIVTWVNTHWRDRSLLDILNLDVLDFVSRKRLFSTRELQKRWTKRLTFLRENNSVTTLDLEQMVDIKLPELDSFSWFMTIVTTALSAALLDSAVESVITNYIVARVDHEKTYFVVKTLPDHLAGWRSTSKARNIASFARARWERLGYDGLHLPGFAPAADAHEFEIFLTWLSGHSDVSEIPGAEGTSSTASDTFRTASSDVWCTAELLREMGFDLQVVRQDQFFDDSRPTVIYDSSMIIAGGEQKSIRRGGMRINLDCPEESISLWPGTQQENTIRRSIFAAGINCTQFLQFRPAQYETGIEEFQKVFDPLIAIVYQPSDRAISLDIQRLAREFLFVDDNSAAQALKALFDSWRLNPTQSHEVADALSNLNPSRLDATILSQFQIFILGYWYGATRKLLDTSRMLVPEAFGAWSWNSLDVCSLLKSIRWLELHDLTTYEPSLAGKFVAYYRKSDILQIVAYLYAAAEIKQTQEIKHESCGFVGKINVLDSTLMGDTDSVPKLCCFSLLDVDGTCFASNSTGVMQGAIIPEAGVNSVAAPPIGNLRDMQRSTQTEADFTSTIEPDWARDIQASRITFRNGGRIVLSVGPTAIFNAILACWPVSSPHYGRSGLFRFSLSSETAQSVIMEDDIPVHIWPLDIFQGATCPITVMPTEHPICINTQSLVKARTCIASIFGFGDLSHTIADSRPRPQGLPPSHMVLNLENYQIFLT
ncbi:MAG: hypothetical protein GOMPHAMPRED_001294 [Gomphillus americanus]|uniref:Uncharacterized protein n=1 Tax=Gomphillus americanus TaxID=1940652 RepID=A0A8H3IL06_9LECA|nr:MAG: hypothetical protein GOMPHAMPRED_001294 [Gomphillus americanus]